MKKLEISLLTMAVVVGGAIGASAATANTTEGDTFQVDLVFPSDAPLSFISVGDIPQGAKALTISNVEANVSVDTDGSGKIEGAGFLRISYGTSSINIDTNTTPPTTNTFLTAYSDYIVDVTGKISSKNNNPNIQETVKGKGTSTTSSNISIINAQAASSSMSVSYTGNSAVSSNGTVAGNLKGSINPGKVQAINGGKTIKVNETAILQVDNIQVPDLPVQVVSFGSKFDAVAGNGIVFRGSGSSSGGKFNSSFKGVGNASGSSFKITGPTAPVAVIIGGSTINVNFVSSGELKGKILGQNVDVKGLSTTSF